ncbi:hypothetical protein ACFLZL_03360 [Thermodesulfobacteriota bacterium]
MTYNFDPDRWYENELAAIRSEYKTGEISKPDYEKAVKKLDEKHAEMWKRLDGSYQI